jgi:MFS family permease
MNDHSRWFVLVAVALSALIVTIDSSVLTVAIPTIMRDFDASLPSVQWVLAGYSLVVASLLVIGGRLGDVEALEPIEPSRDVVLGPRAD